MHDTIIVSLIYLNESSEGRLFVSLSSENGTTVILVLGTPRVAGDSPEFIHHLTMAKTVI